MGLRGTSTTHRLGGPWHQVSGQGGSQSRQRHTSNKENTRRNNTNNKKKEDDVGAVDVSLALKLETGHAPKLQFFRRRCLALKAGINSLGAGSSCLDEVQGGTNVSRLRQFGGRKMPIKGRPGWPASA